jgi:hypothetical protein
MFLGTKIKIEIDYDNNFPIILNLKYIKDSKVYKKEIFMKNTYIDEYGNTRYEDDIFHQIIEQNKYETFIKKFVVK